MSSNCSSINRSIYCFKLEISSPKPKTLQFSKLNTGFFTKLFCTFLNIFLVLDLFSLRYLQYLSVSLHTKRTCTNLFIICKSSLKHKSGTFIILLVFLFSECSYTCILVLYLHLAGIVIQFSQLASECLRRTSPIFFALRG